MEGYMVSMTTMSRIACANSTSSVETMIRGLSKEECRCKTTRECNHRDWTLKHKLIFNALLVIFTTRSCIEICDVR